MTLTVPLAVRLVTPRAAQLVTADARDLRFRSTTPRGYASCSVPLDRPIRLQHDEAAYYGQLHVYDKRNGNEVWVGRLEDRQPGVGSDGEVLALAAVGPGAFAQDQADTLIYADTTLDHFTPTPISQKHGEIGSEQTAGGVDGIKLYAPRGTEWDVNQYVAVQSLRFRESGMEIARISYSWEGIAASPNWRVKGVADPTATVFEDDALAVGIGGATGETISGSLPLGTDMLRVLFQRANFTAVPDDKAFVILHNVRLRGRLFDAAGAYINTGYTADTVLASEAFRDLVGRISSWTAFPVVDATTYGIDQLAYYDGATPAQVLDDLMALEPEYFWAAWGSAPNEPGRYRVEWKRWPTTVRYEADVFDGAELPGSAGELYNEVIVRWKDAAKKTRRTPVTSSVPVLDAAGVPRRAFLDLGDSAGSLANATQAGQTFLAFHALPSSSGRVRIARPILDLVTGRKVMPWEIRPGNLIRLRQVLPRTAAIQPGGRDGVSTFRIVATEFSASDAAADLDLDAPPMNTPQMLADLRRSAASTRR